MRYIGKKMLLASFAASAASFAALNSSVCSLTLFSRSMFIVLSFLSFQVDINSVNKLVFVNRLCQVIHSTNLKSSSLKLVTDIGSSQKTIGILLVFFSFLLSKRAQSRPFLPLNIKNDKIHSLFKQNFNAFSPELASFTSAFICSSIRVLKKTNYFRCHLQSELCIPVLALFSPFKIN